MKVQKRDGKIVKFDITRVENAVRKAFKSANVEVTEDVINSIDESFNDLDNEDGTPIKIELIQDRIEQKLYQLGYYQVAKVFILYREKRKEVRDWTEEKMKFIDKYKGSSNTANATVDDNSNVGNKNIGILNSEIHKSDNILISRRMITEKLRELFPDFDYKQYERDLNSHIIYKHDESSFAGAIAPYCCSITMYPFLLGGIKGIGGLSAKPKNLDSFCGMYINLIFATSAMFAGACLYKDQNLIVNNKSVSIKSLVDSVFRSSSNISNFKNFQGDWEYVDVSSMDMSVMEDERLVPITKVYRRKYNKNIYEIKTRDGHVARVSEDHKFKVLFKGRIIEIPAKDLNIYDTVFVCKDLSVSIDKTSDEFKKGWISGIICGDGSLTEENTVRLSVNYKQKWIYETFNEYSEDIYGYSLNIGKGHNCFDCRKYSKEFYELIHNDIIGNTTYDKHIDVNNHSLDYLIGFLDGLFCADGSYTKGRGIRISLTNKELSDNISEIIQLLYYNKPTVSTIPEKLNRKKAYCIYVPSVILKYLKHTINKKINNEYKSDGKVVETSYYGPMALSGKNSTNKFNCWSSSNKDENYKLDVISEISTFKNDDEYVYEIETESHWYNCGGFITHNCATSEFLLYFDYFARKEWGDNYYMKPDMVITTPSCIRQKTIGSQIHQYFQQVIYSINQPAAARGLQSAFVNFSYFDKPFFEGMFGDFYFPDGTKPKWESLNWLQKDFMMWFNEERLKTIITFPVESFALVYQDGHFLDQENADFVAAELARGHSFFVYISDTVDSLSSCCRLKNMVQTKEFNFTNGNMGVD